MTVSTSLYPALRLYRTARYELPGRMEMWTCAFGVYLPTYSSAWPTARLMVHPTGLKVECVLN